MHRIFIGTILLLSFATIVWAQTFGPVVLVDTSTANLTYQAGGNLAVDYQGSLGVAWTDATNNNDIISFAKSTDQGQTWQKTVVCDDPLEDPRDMRLDAALAFNPIDNPWVVWDYYIWESISEYWVQAAQSVDGGVTFENQRIIELSNFRVSKTIAIDNNSTVYIPSVDYRGLICNVLPEGDFSKRYQTVVSPLSLAPFDFPDFQTAGRDTIFIAFKADSSDHYKPKLIYFTQSTDAGSTFTEPILISGEAYQPGHYGAQSASLALDELKTIYLAWADDRTGDYDVYFSKSIDGGNTFSSSVRVNNQLEGQQFIVRISYNSSTGLCVAWVETHDLQDNDIYFARSIDGGETFSDGILICGEEHQAFYQGLGGIATDDSGNVYIAYTDNRFGKQLLFVTKATLESTNVIEHPSLLALPEKATLQQNYPNPFNAETLIRYQIPNNSYRVTLRIFDLLGRVVKTLVDQRQDGGDYQIVWDGKDKDGKDVGSGVYFCSLTVGPVLCARKIVLIR